jgi:S-(hydroxymethyl)glutathione dehydrogenase/alcohol dehydrogenase
MSLPKSTKAAVLTALLQPLQLMDVTLPKVLAAGQVLVKVLYSGICGSQLGEIDGAKGEDKWLPHLLGHEASGEVLSTGPGVRGVKTGDSVVLHWRKGPGIDAETPHLTSGAQKINCGAVTTFSQYTIVSENRVTRIPAESDMQLAALFGCAVTTGFGVIENNARVRIGESVVVFGAGGIGLNIIQAAALVGAWPIIAVDRHGNKEALARELGATHFIDSSTHDADAEIAKLLPEGVDAFIDNTGQPSIIELGYRLSKAQGRVTLVGVPRKGSNINIYSLPLHFGKSLSGSHGGNAEPATDIPRYQRLLAAGRIHLAPLVTEIFALDEINTAIERMRSGAIIGRCLVDMERGA